MLDYTHFGDSSDFRGIGSDQARFRRMGAMKVAAFHQLLMLNRTVLVSDVDTVWTADPQPYLESLSASVDIGVTSDCLSREADENKFGKSKRFAPQGVWFCGHNPGNTFGATFNTGVLYLRPTPAAVDEFVAAVLGLITAQVLVFGYILWDERRKAQTKKKKA